MKIALLRRKFDANGGGGAEKVAVNFAREFMQRGHSVTVFSEKFDSGQGAGPDWVKVPKGGIASLSGTAAFHKNVQKLLKEHKFDIVYTMCRTFPTDVFRVTEQLHAEWMPVGYSKLACLNPRHRSILRLERLALSPLNTRHVVTNSELVKRQVAERFGYPEHRISVVRNGVDRQIFFPVETPAEKEKLRQNLELPAAKLILLFAAGNFRIKGLESAMRAIAGLEAETRDRALIVVLGGDDSRPWLKLAADLDLADKVLFVGRQKNMRDYYAASDLLLYPSMYEPFANVCLEACACALPVLTTRLNGSSELVEHGINGYLVDNAECVKEMTVGIEAFAALSENARSEFSSAARDAANDYSWERHADDLENIFIKLMEHK